SPCSPRRRGRTASWPPASAASTSRSARSSRGGTVAKHSSAARKTDPAPTPVGAPKRRPAPAAALDRLIHERVRLGIVSALGIGQLTLYAFSADNWRRPPREVAYLMRLFARHLRTETAELLRNGVRLEVVGRRDRLPAVLVAAIAAAESATAAGTRLHLRLAVDYSSRAAIRAGTLLPDVDLLIRTGGEQRLSDFLLWEAAYAEL